MPPVTRLTIWIAISCSAVTVLPGRTPEPQLRWRVRLSGITKESVGPAQRPVHPVIALRFSPDGKWIAAAVEHATGGHAARSDEIIVLPSDGDLRSASVFQVGNRLLGGDSTAIIHWAPSNERIAFRTRAGGAVLRVGDGSTCDFGEVSQVGGFVDDAHLIGATWGKPSAGRAYTINDTAVSLFRNDCGRDSGWSFRGRIDRIEANPRGRMAAVLPDQSETRLVSIETGDVLVRLPIFPSASSLHFGAGGAALCVGRHTAASALSCYSTATGKEIAQHPSIKGGSPLDVSLDGTLVLASDTVVHYNALTERSRDEWKRWVVWDFASGQDIAVLRYRTQRIAMTTKKNDEVPFAAAISPNGGLFVIGGDDEVLVYTVPVRNPRD